MARHIRVGPAGWSYADWNGIVYPKPKPKGFDPLVYLSRYFDTIEINSTFYRPVSVAIAKTWVAKVRPQRDFKFTAKLSRRFTHERKEAWTKDELRETRSGFDALAGEGVLGAVLVQFPWSFRRTDENREWLDDVLTAFTRLPLVVEVRHASWDTPEFFTELLERGVGFVNVDQPLFGKSIPPSARATAAVGYIRVHGRNYKNWFRKSASTLERYDYMYKPEELKKWATRAQEVANSEVVREVFVVTNNHARGKAPANALMIQSLLTKEKVDAPPTLVASYTQELAPFVRKAAVSEPTTTMDHFAP
jgi:uncharacterized protein YecE (DUF72 family)